MGLLADYAAKLRAIAAELEAKDNPVPPNPEPAPLPVPPTFDEAWYLLRYPDVKAAIPQYFSSGWDHYNRCGRAEGRFPTPTVTPGPPPVPVPLPSPPPAPAPWGLADQYASVANFYEVLAAHRDHMYGVNLDNRDAFGDGVARFGPATNYYSWPDGTVRLGTPPGGQQPARSAPNALLDSYANRAELIKDAQDIGWTWAVLLDGEPLLGGFEAVPPANYVTRNGQVVRA